MDLFIEFINLFLLPLSTLFLYYKKSGREADIVEKAGLYALFCVLNLIFVKAVCAVLRSLCDVGVSMLSVKYTVIAFACSLVLCFLSVVFTDFIHVELFLRKRDEGNGKEK